MKVQNGFKYINSGIYNAFILGRIRYSSVEEYLQRTYKIENWQLQRITYRKVPMYL